MKQHNKYHKIPTIAVIMLCFVYFLSACVKSREGRTDFSSLQPVVLIPEGGLARFSSQALLFPGTDNADTTTFHVNYAATNVAPVDEVVTLAVDGNALTTYNATGSTKYILFPDSIYSFRSTSVTIKKGNNYTDALPLIVFPSKIDPSLNLMLPISIKVAPVGSTISTNFGTIYYHLIGNPIAGAYTQEWIRYNNAGGTGSPAYDVTSAGVFAPLSPTTISVSSGTGISYNLSFTNTAGVISNFQLIIDPASVNGITISGGPTLVTADPVAKKYEFNFTYINGSGKSRNITDKFNK